MSEAARKPEAKEPEPVMIDSRKAAVGMNIDEGPDVEMRVTSWGHGEISAGTNFGFDRYPEGAKITAKFVNAYSLWTKRFAEPLDRAWVDKFKAESVRQQRLEATSKRRQDSILVNGAAAGTVEGWNG